MTRYKITKDNELILTDWTNILMVPDIFNKTILIRGSTLVIDEQEFSLEWMPLHIFQAFCKQAIYNDLDFLFSS